MSEIAIRGGTVIDGTGSQITSVAGDIQITGAADAGESINLDTNSLLTTDSGDISLVGTGSIVANTTITRTMPDNSAASVFSARSARSGA